MQDNRGYFLIDTIEEMNEYRRNLQNRINETMERLVMIGYFFQEKQGQNVELSTEMYDDVTDL